MEFYGIYKLDNTMKWELVFIGDKSNLKNIDNFEVKDAYAFDPDSFDYNLQAFIIKVDKNIELQFLDKIEGTKNLLYTSLLKTNKNIKYKIKENLVSIKVKKWK